MTLIITFKFAIIVSHMPMSNLRVKKRHRKWLRCHQVVIAFISGWILNREMLSLSMCTFLHWFHHMLSCSAPTDTSNIILWENRWFSRHLQLFMVNLKKYLVLRISSYKLWIPMDGPRYAYRVLNNVSLNFFLCQIWH
jgi:hypothetical protein